MTLVQFIVNFLRPYVDLPEFTSCVMKALKELKHPISKVPVCEWEPKIVLNGKEARVVFRDDSVSDKVWDDLDKVDPAKFETCGINCNE